MTLKNTLPLIAAVGWALPALAEVNVQLNEEGETYTGVFVNGSSTTKYDIVFIGDGFTADEQDEFNYKVSQAIEALWNLHPFSDHMCAFNIWRVNVVSVDSGIDHPGQYPDIYRNTELDCTFGNPLDPNHPEPLRLIKSLSPPKCYEAAGHAPASDAVFVLVNETNWGGAAGGLVFSSIHPDFHQIITHELGHKIGGLADEYPYYWSENDTPSTYSGPEPSQPNITTKTQFSEIKWNDLIQPGTPLPTTLNNSSGHPLGLWEGAKYKAYGIYRPQHTCQMRDSADHFCAVCARHMAGILQTYEVEPANLVCSGVLRELLALGKMPWEEVDMTFIIPWCLTCPPHVGGFDDVVYYVDGLPAGFRVNIVDESGEVVARGGPVDGGLLASFDAEPGVQYFVDVIGNAARNGDVVEFESQLFVNGKEQALP